MPVKVTIGEQLVGVLGSGLFNSCFLDGERYGVFLSEGEEIHVFDFEAEGISQPVKLNLRSIGDRVSFQIDSLVGPIEKGQPPTLVRRTVDLEMINGKTARQLRSRGKSPENVTELGIR